LSKSGLSHAPLDRIVLHEHLAACRFSELFTQGMGWNWPRSAEPIIDEIDRVLARHDGFRDPPARAKAGADVREPRRYRARQRLPHTRRARGATARPAPEDPCHHLSRARSAESFPPEWRKPLDEERLPIATQFFAAAKRITAVRAEQRNRWLAEQAHQIVVAWATPGGRLEATLRGLPAAKRKTLR
jgi:hypothetical protein